MFKNIGKKIKVLAQVFCWIGIGISALAALGMIVSAVGMSRYVNPVALILGAILVLGLGFLISWISSFMLYGFGELIDKTSGIHEAVNAICRQNSYAAQHPQAPAASAAPAAPAATDNTPEA